MNKKTNDINKGICLKVLLTKQSSEGSNKGTPCTVELRFNDPLYNKVLDIINDFLRAGQSYSEMYGLEPWYNEILVMMNTIQEKFTLKHSCYIYICTLST